MSHQFKVDDFRTLITAEERAELDERLSAGHTSVSIKRWLDDKREEYQDQGVELPYCTQSAVDRWYRANRQIAERARELKTISSELQGIDPEDLSRVAVLANLKILQASSNLLTLERLDNCATSTILAAQQSAARALQAIATETRKQEDLQTTRTLERAGAYRVIEIMRQMAKDSRFAKEIDDFAKAALAQFETES